MIRSDYNFVFLCFAYFVFVSSREHFVTTVVTSLLTEVFGIVAALMVLDVLFFIFVPRTWMTEDVNNTVWNSLRSMHGFAIILSVLILLLKVHSDSMKAPLLYFLWSYRRESQMLLAGNY